MPWNDKNSTSTTAQGYASSRDCISPSHLDNQHVTEADNYKNLTLQILTDRKDALASKHLEPHQPSRNQNSSTTYRTPIRSQRTSIERPPSGNPRINPRRATVPDAEYSDFRTSQFIHSFQVPYLAYIRVFTMSHCQHSLLILREIQQYPRWA